MDSKNFNSTKFTIIEGNLLIDPLEAGGNFVSAEVTDTRLMGVIGVHVIRDRDGDSFHQFFYIDTEEYGLDDYQSFLNMEKDAVEKKKVELFGALGGSWNPITEKEAIHLVKRASMINGKQKLPLPEGTSEYRPIIESDVTLSLKELASLWIKMTSPIRSDYELINYFIMRMVACDREGMARLSGVKPNITPLNVQNPGTLLKNEIKKKDGSDDAEDGKKAADSSHIYSCVSLMDLDKVYQLVESEIEVSGTKVVKFRHREPMQISPWEASLILNQAEYLVHASMEKSSDDGTKFTTLMKSLFSTVTESEYDFGSLFMIFRKNNDHVRKRVYRLDQDTLGVVLLLHSGEIVFAGSDPMHLEAVETSIIAASMLEGISINVGGRYKFLEPILVRFIDSDFERFSDFLEYIQGFQDR